MYLCKFVPGPNFVNQYECKESNWDIIESLSWWLDVFGETSSCPGQWRNSQVVLLGFVLWQVSPRSNQGAAMAAAWQQVSDSRNSCHSSKINCAVRLPSIPETSEKSSWLSGSLLSQLTVGSLSIVSRADCQALLWYRTRWLWICIFVPILKQHFTVC